ncbi:MAG: putative baseplate assembly protein [Anaerolineae bacterium]
MPLPEPRLDDLRFQSIVDEARKRIIHYCPEWTDYNLSDPGITLIELFAWMTEVILYRLNRVPEKSHINFLDMLGVQLQPASSARTELTFWLSTAFPIKEGDDTVAVVPKGTEVATRRIEGQEEIIFTTDQRLTVVPPILTQLRKDENVHKNYLPSLGVGSVGTFVAFQEVPREGDAFYLGFDPENKISGHILRLMFWCEMAKATGIKVDDPPLVWECSVGNDQWERVPVSVRSGEEDTTGGFNSEEGRVVLYLPLSMAADRVHGRLAYWVRCRFQTRPGQNGYTQSPRITGIEASTLGASTRATHAVIRQGEALGYSTGDPGQTFTLSYAPILDLQEGESVVVEEMRGEQVALVPWERVADFSISERFDRHFTLDTATGEIGFGPAIQQPSGTVRQYGRVPEMGRQIRFTRYRHGGGGIGNVPADRLQVLKTSLPYIKRVTNLYRAEGGRDQEVLEEAVLRARREMRAQRRAVTVEDFENLSKKASRSVARVKCLSPQQVGSRLPPGMIELVVVPAVFDSVRAGDLSKLWLREHGLEEQIIAYLDQYRLLGTTLQVREPRYFGVKVVAEVVPAEYSHPETVRLRVIERLKSFLTPLALDDVEIISEMLGFEWEGWPFGRDLYVSEIFSLIQQIDGIKHVLDVQISYREVDPGELVKERVREEQQSAEAPMGEKAEPESAEATLESELSQLQDRVLRVAEDTLICSLLHDVRIVEL